MRGQASLELFFSVSLFVLMLFWLNHFVGVASDVSASSGVSAARTAAQSLAEMADAACLAQASVSAPSPCLSVSGPLRVSVAGRFISVGGVTAATRCGFSTGSAVSYACGDVLCMAFVPDGSMRLSGGACP